MNIYPLTREALNEQAKEGKENCDCGGPWEAHLMSFSQDCHPGIGMLLGYHPVTGCLFLSCPACKKAFGMIQVANEVDDVFEGIEHTHILGIVVALSKGMTHPDAPKVPKDPSLN